MSTRRRTVLAVLAAVVGLAVVAGAWLAVTAAQARTELTAARTAVGVLRDRILQHQLTATAAPLRTAQQQARRAHQRTSGPVWSLAAQLPWVGAPFRTARGLAAAADTLADRVLPSLVTTARALDPAALRTGPHQVNLEPLRRAAPALAGAAVRVSGIRTAVDRLPAGTWLGPVNTARASLAHQVGQLDATLHDAALAARLLPPMLGADGPRHYLLVFQNDAEARGTGGLPGAFALLTADHGRLSLSDFANDTAMAGVHVPVPYGRAYEASYGTAQPGNVFVNTNLSPHFPYAAKLWMAYWRKKTGQQLDGALATDPTALAELLQVTGPAALADGTAVSAATVVSLTEQAAYSRYSDVSARKAFFLQVARVAANRIFHAGGATSSLLHALGTAAGQHRLLVYSAHPAEERLLAPTPLSGVVPDGPAPFSAFVVNNGAGTKLDYYLHRQIRWQAGTCSGPTRRSTVTVTLTNSAPPSGLPAYVATRHDDGAASAPPDSERLLTSLFATRGAQLLSLRVDGQPATVMQLTERGHPVWETPLDLAAGQTRTLVYRLVTPTAAGAPRLDVQPGLTRTIATASVPAC